MLVVCLVLTSYALAKEFIVSASTGNDATGNADTGEPFSTMSGAFNSKAGSMTSVIVTLKPSETPYIFSCHDAQTELVFRTDCGGTCSETQRATILIKPSTTCYFRTTKLSFIDVVLTDYQDDLCSYCIVDQLYIELNGVKVLANGTEKTTIDQIRSTCPIDFCPANAQTFKLFSHQSSNANSSFTLERVKLESIRAGYSSFIGIVGVLEVTLKDCNLTDLYFSGFVFDVSSVANFTATNCSITNLHPNFPIKQVAQDIGLLRVITGTSVSLDRVVFADNNALPLYETYAFNIGAQRLTINSCTFKNNLMSLIKTTAQRLVVSGTKDFNTLFEGNYAYGYPLVLAYSDTFEVSMNFTAFKSNHCKKCGNLFEFTSLSSPHTATLDYITVSNSGMHTDTTSAVLSVVSFLNISMTNCDFSDNTKYNEDYASHYSTLNRFINIDTKHVITPLVQDLLKLPKAPRCSRVVHIEESLALVIESSKFKSNSGCDSALIIKQSKLNENHYLFKLTDVSFEDSSRAVQVTTSCSDECAVVFTDCAFLNNIKSLELELDSSMKATVSRSSFTQANLALQTQYGLYFSGSYLEVTSCTFTGLRSQSTSALFITTPTTGSTTVAISSSNFINTISKSGFSDLTIENAESALLLTISNCRFQSNYEDNYASLSITGNKLQSNSAISNTLFTGYRFTSTICFSLTTYSSQLSVQNVTFNNIKMTPSLIDKFLITARGTSDGVVPSVDLANCIFSDIKATAVISLSSFIGRPYLASYSNTFNKIEGSCVYVLVGTFIDDSSVVEDSRTTLYGLIEINKGTYTILRNTSVRNCTFDLYGAIHLTGFGTTLYASHLSITNSTSSFLTIILIEKQSTVTFDTLQIIGCSTPVNKPIIYMNFVNNVSITNSSFRQNTSGSLIRAITCYGFVISNSLFDDNRPPSDNIISPSLEMYDATLSVLNCTFTNYDCKSAGCLGYISSGSTMNSTDSTYANSYFNLTPFKVITSTVLFNRGRVYNNTVETQGFIKAIDASSVSFNAVSLTDLTFRGAISNSVILSQDSTLAITNSTFARIDGQVLEATLGSIEISDSVIDSITNLHSLGAVFAFSSQVVIKRSVFKDIAATCVVYAINSEKVGHYQVLVNACNFTSNLGELGAAVHISGYNFTLVSSNFTGNVASVSGAGVLLECMALKCAYNLTGNSFEHNRAEVKGGAVYWTDYEPTFADNYFLNNSASYGANTASYAVGLTLLDRRLTELTNVASSQPLSYQIRLGLIDVNGQIVTTDNSTRLSLEPEDSEAVMLSGSTGFTAVNGEFTVANFTVTAEPGTNQALRLKVNGLDTSKLKSAPPPISISIPVSLRLCEAGEIKNGKACSICTKNSYSLDTSDATCLGCMASADCLGGASIYPHAEYWRSSNSTDYLIKCLRPKSCMGNDNYTSLTGACADGYRGKLCNSCDLGWSRTDKDTCGPCPHPAVNSIRLIGLTFVVVVVFGLLVRSTLKSSRRTADLKSVYFKIFLNYLQLATLTASFNLSWPSFVTEFLSAQSKSGDVTEQVLSIDCFIQEQGEKPEFIKLIVMAVIPFNVIIVSCLVWGVVALYRRSLANVRNELATTLLVLAFMTHPNIVKSMFSAFSCFEVDPGELWLRTDLETRCWVGDHNKYSFGVALPGLIVWGVGIPLVALYLLIRKRRSLYLASVKAQYSFLYLGYKMSHFYWEFVILYRKLIIAFISVFLINISVHIQALTVLLVLLGALVLQAKHEPFTEPQLNELEFRSILTSLVTIYCGLFYLTEDLEEVMKVILFLLIVTLNAYFILYWIGSYLFIWLSTLAQSYPSIVLRYCWFYPSLARVANRELEGIMITRQTCQPEVLDDMRSFYIEVARTKLS
jgi:hypothetical protein